MRNLPAIEQQLSLLGWFSSDYIGVLAMGFFYGLTLCSLSCLPMLTPYLFAQAGQEQGRTAGFMTGFHLTALFIAARVATYAILGAAAGGLGEMLLKRMDEGVFLPVAGGMVVLVGMAVAFGRKAACSHHGTFAAGQKTSVLHMVGLGLATTLMPCLPLTAVLMLAATRGSVMEGAVLGLLFGAGTAVSPLYYLGGAMGWLARRIMAEIPKHAGLLRRISGLMLVLLGLRLMLS